MSDVCNLSLGGMEKEENRGKKRKIKPLLDREERCEEKRKRKKKKGVCDLLLRGMEGTGEYRKENDNITQDSEE